MKAFTINFVMSEGPRGPIIGVTNPDTHEIYGAIRLMPDRNGLWTFYAHEPDGEKLGKFDNQMEAVVACVKKYESKKGAH